MNFFDKAMSYIQPIGEKIAEPFAEPRKIVNLSNSGVLISSNEDTESQISESEFHYTKMDQNENP